MKKMYQVVRVDGVGEIATVEESDLISTCDRMSENGKHPLRFVEQQAPSPISAPETARASEEPKTAPGIGGAPEARINSTFAAPVVDDTAKMRIEAMHTALISSGISVNTREQLFATGTRMADVGYAKQAARVREHEAKKLVRDVAQEAYALVRAEQRDDVTITAGEFGKAVVANGKITFDGLQVQEQAIRGLATRLESPMLGYVLGLRDRIVGRATDLHVLRASLPDHAESVRAVVDEMHRDRAEIARVIAYECARNPDATLKLRTRRGEMQDIYAIVSPSYAPADAPEVLDDLVSGLPADTRGTFAYDPSSTAWELRASVWTPTAVEEQAVGEPFEGYVSFQSRDNGTSRFRGGGGAMMLRCLNASTYVAEGVTLSRVHRAGVRRDIAAMLRHAKKAIDALCMAWGRNREAVLEMPSGVKINDAIPGFWRSILQDRRGELAGVLPGRSEEHVTGLTSAYMNERRDKSRIVRADLGQAWTRYIQDQPIPVLRDAELAIGDWLVRARPIGCDVR